MMKLEDIKIGQKVWVVANWAHTPISGTVESIKYIGPSEPYAKVCWDSHFGTSGVLLDELYASLEDLQKEEKAKQNAAVAEIKSTICDVKDLVVFMYHIVLNGDEDVDYDAKRAVCERAKELLDLNLE